MILLKKTGYSTKINKIEKKITSCNHDKYITTQEFNKLTSENFAARLAQANLASKTDITDFIQKRDFDGKLKKLNKKVSSNKTKHVLVENELNTLLQKVKPISTKRLTKDLMNKYSILKEKKKDEKKVRERYKNLPEEQKQKLLEYLKKYRLIHKKVTL